MKRTLPAVLAFLFVTVSAFAAEAPQRVQKDWTKIDHVGFYLRAEPIDGELTQLNVQFLKGVTGGIRIVTMPSGTTLAAFADNSRGDGAVRQWLRDGIAAGEQSDRVLELAIRDGAEAQFVVPAAPEGDTEMFIYVLGRFPGEHSEREGVFKLRTGLRRPYRSTFRRLETHDEHCCGDPSGAPCYYACTWCPWWGFPTCCVTSGCGGCNQNEATCGIEYCTGCLVSERTSR